MNVIWKFPLPMHEIVPLKLSADAEVLSIQEQRGALTMWVSLDPNDDTVDRTFRIVGTGHSYDDTKLHYLDTAQVGRYVWHVFEVLL